MLQDALWITLAFGLWPLLAVAPGYAASLLFDPFACKTRSMAQRMLIALPLSLAIAPSVLYVSWKFAGFPAAIALVLVCSIITVSHLLMHLKVGAASLWRQRFILAASAAWIGLSFAMLMPLQLGDKLFLSVVWDDYSKHVAVTHAITRTDVPPAQPYFAPGERIPMHYYYGWFLQSALIDRIGGQSVGPEHAVTAGTIWTGLALFACLLAMAKFLCDDIASSASRYRWVAILLLVSGLDVIPIFLRNCYFWSRNSPEYSRSVEWWNEQVSGWLDMMLWVPHHVGAAVAGIIALLLIRERKGSVHIGAIVLAAMGFCSCSLMSVYVAMTIALCAMIWITVCLVQRRTHEAVSFVAAGLLALTFALPWLAELQHTRSAQAFPLAFAVREFTPAESVLLRTSFNTQSIKTVLNLALLPLNYAMEFGFYALVVFLVRWKRSETLSTNQLLGVTVTIVCVTIATFVRSTMQFNDVGWRSLIPAQAMLLIAGTSLMPRIHAWLGFHRKAAWTLLALGIGTTTLDLLLMRFSPIYDHLRSYPNDRVALASDLREVHQWIDRNTPVSSVILYRQRADLGHLHGNFSRRQVAVADMVYGPLLGGDPRLYDAWRIKADDVFDKVTLDEQSLRTIHDLKVDYLIVIGSDPLWNGRDNLGDAVLYETGFAMVIDCARIPADKPVAGGSDEK